MKRMDSKAVVLLITIAVLLTVTVGGTVAYLAASTPSVTNVFTPGSTVPEINEDLEGNVKKKVTIKNTGNVDAYIRAKIVVTWQDTNGNVYPTMPVKDTDYTISINMTDWELDGGFYYYKGGTNGGKVSAQGSTTNLINTCQLKEGATVPSGYTLHVEILAQAIQADGWPSTVTDAKSAFDAAASTN